MKRNAFILLSLSLLTLAAAPVHAEGMDMGSHKHMEGMATTQNHQGEGVVNSVDIKAGKVNLSHGPVATLNWPAMTMDFEVMERASLSALKPGQKVVFKLVEKRKGKYVISEISAVK